MQNADRIELKLSPHDYAWGHVLHKWLLPLKTPRAWIFIGVAVVVGLWLNGSVGGLQTHSVASYLTAFFILIPAWLLKEYLFVYQYYRRTSLPSCQISLRAEGLHYQYPGFEYMYAWPEMRALSSVGRFTFLRVGGRRFLILSRAAFASPEHYADWQRAIRTQLDQRPAPATKV